MLRFLPILSMVALLLLSCGRPSYRGSVLEEPVPVPEMALMDQFGQPFHLEDQRGQVVLLFFGYTSCPTTLASWRRVHEVLGEDAARAHFVFVTADPGRDTPDRLGLHVNTFHPEFVGLTGT